MRFKTRFIAAAVAAALVVSCSSGPKPKLVATAPAPADLSGGLPYHWTQGEAPKAHKDLVAAFGKPGLGPGQFVWASSVPTEGDARVVVDLLTETAYAYRGDKLVGAASISSARQGHITPYGTWTILEKRPFYRSKKYDNAPMPWMQRFDEYGTAMHGGFNPGYPASHGCIRMPMKFAEKLYAITRVGSKVVIEG